MKLSRPVKLAENNRIRAVCLPAKRLAHNQTDLCIATGWGRDREDGDLAGKLLETRVPVHDNALCRKKYGRSVPIRSGHLCAGHLDGSTGTCVVSRNRKTQQNLNSLIIKVRKRFYSYLVEKKRNTLTYHTGFFDKLLLLLLILAATVAGKFFGKFHRQERSTWVMDATIDFAEF